MPNEKWKNDKQWPNEKWRKDLEKTEDTKMGNQKL